MAPTSDGRGTRYSKSVVGSSEKSAVRRQQKTGFFAILGEGSLASPDGRGIEDNRNVVGKNTLGAGFYPSSEGLGADSWKRRESFRGDDPEKVLQAGDKAGIK